ncbi:MAG: alpha/beta hydrolase [Calditrichia bacterium]
MPPGYNPEARSYPILYVNDGSDYIKLGKMVNVLDNLLSGNKIHPLVVVFIDPVDRMKEYDMSDTYLQMLAEELIPFIEKKYGGPGSTEKRGIMGPSLGGLISLYAGLKFPGLFGFVAGQSSSIQFHKQAIISLYNESEPVTTKIYLDWGAYESTRDLSVQFVKMLQSKGYRIIHKEYNEGHSWGNWRAHLDDILVAFVGTQSLQFVD